MNNLERQKKKKPSRSTKIPTPPSSYLRFIGLAMEWCLYIAVGTYAGYWLDSYAEAYKPLFLIMGLLLGMTCAGIRLYTKVIKS